jgi:20S proteasome alpha/beta subunit
MTLAIGVIAGDGIALAADSRTTHRFAGQDQPWRVMSDFTHKVFKVGDVGIATYGYAVLSGRNIASHMSEFEATHAGLATAKDVADALADFFNKRFVDHLAVVPGDVVAAGLDALGFLVGGHDAGLACLYEVGIPNGGVKKLGDSTTGTAVWRGQTDVVQRLVKGADLAELAKSAAKAGVTPALTSLEAAALPALEYVILFQTMNLQDAVDFAVLLIRTTIDVQRLTHGTSGDPGSWPGVGGPIEIATVTSTGGFEWLQKTELQPERPSGLAERA